VPADRLGPQERNEQLLNPPLGSAKPPDASGRPTAPVSPEFGNCLSSCWIGLTIFLDRTRGHPIRMLNLLSSSTVPCFAESVGSRHGGVAKIAGNVVSGQDKEERLG